MSVVVQPSVKKGMSGLGIFRNIKMRAPNSASGTEPARMTRGSRKLLNWAGKHKKDEHHGKSEGGKELVPLGPELA